MPGLWFRSAATGKSDGQFGAETLFRSGIFPAKFEEKCFFSMGYGQSVSHAKQPVGPCLAKHLRGFAPDFSSKIFGLLFEFNALWAKCFACETRQHRLRFAAHAALTSAQPVPITLPAFRERTSHGQA